MRETSAQSPFNLMFPKAQRFLLAEWLGKMALDFYEIILEAVTQSAETDLKISQADRMLVKIRLYVRLSHDLQCISLGQYEHAVKQMEEIGRLIGGWKKKQQSRK